MLHKQQKLSMLFALFIYENIQMKINPQINFYSIFSKKMPNFTFIFLFLLNFQLPNLSAATPFQFLFDKIDSFDGQFTGECKTFRESIKKIKMRAMGNEFNEAIKIIVLVGQIPELKKNVEKFLEGNGKFEEISKKLDELKMGEGKIKDLAALANKLEIEINKEEEKKMKENIERKEGEYSGTNANEKEGNELKPEAEIPLKSRLSLVRELLELCKTGNNFVDEVRAELQIRQPFENLTGLNDQMEKGRIKFEKYFGDFFNKDYAIAFQKIVNLIKGVKRELRNANEKPQSPFSEAALKYKNGQKRMPVRLRNNEAELEKALSDENLLLEAPEFKAVPQNVLILQGISEIKNHHGKMRELISHSANQLPKVLNGDYFFQQKQQEYSNSRDLELLNSACRVMFEIMTNLVLGKIHKLAENYYLADIRWLADFIKAQIRKIEENPAKMNLPTELAIDNFNEKITSNAKNILSITIEMNKIYNFEEAIREIRPNVSEEYGKRKLEKMVMEGMNAKNENVCDFFYEKYVKMEKEKEAAKESSSAKIEHSRQMDEGMNAELGHSMGRISLGNDTKEESKGKEHAKEVGPSSPRDKAENM